MREREPIMTKTLKASQAREQFSQLLNQVFKSQTRVLIEKSGIPVAAIISVADLERLNQLEEERQREFAVLDEIGEAFKDVPLEEIEREVVKALATVLKKRRAHEQRVAKAS